MERKGITRIQVCEKMRVARSPAPHYPQTTEDQAHSRLTSAITAPQTPRLRPPAAGDCAAQPLTGTRRAALLGTCARARATRRHAPSVARADKRRKSGLVVAVAPADPEALSFSLLTTRGSVRTEKITRLREQIRQGTYHIRAAEVAKAILRSEPLTSH